jgi:hypothetical protein
MPGVAANISVSIDATQTGSGDLGTPKFRVQKSKALQWAAGTAAVNQADVLFSDTRTLTASATEDLDLAGVLSSVFGATIAAAEVLLIYIEAAAGNTNNVVFGPAAVNGFPGPFGDVSDRIAVRPGEFSLLASQTGWAVGAGATDTITVTNSGAGTGVDYDIVVIGRTVAA